MAKKKLTKKEQELRAEFRLLKKEEQDVRNLVELRSNQTFPNLSAMEDTEFLTLDELAKVFRVKRSRVDTAVRNNKIPCVVVVNKMFLKSLRAAVMTSSRSSPLPAGEASSSSAKK